jgi:hypothetical protein
MVSPRSSLGGTIEPSVKTHGKECPGQYDPGRENAGWRVNLDPTATESTSGQYHFCMSLQFVIAVGSPSNSVKIK